MKVPEVIIMIVSKTDREGMGAPLAYGSGTDPAPEMLLRDRGATVFPDEAQARAALTESLKLADNRGHSWQYNYRFRFVPLNRPDDD